MRYISTVKLVLMRILNGENSKTDSSRYSVKQNRRIHRIKTANNSVSTACVLIA